MERLFSPCTRLRDIFENQDRVATPENFQEFNLDVSTEELLSAEKAFTYADLYAVLGNRSTVVWLTPHAAIASEHGRAFRSWRELHEASCRVTFVVDDKAIHALATSREHLFEICDIVFRLLAATVVHSVRLYECHYLLDDGAWISAPSLAYLMEQCQSLKALSLYDLTLDEHHCRVLGTYSRSDLEIELSLCTITDAGASTLVEVLGRNQGPTKLSCCHIDHSILADGLRGNSRLKSFTQHFIDNNSVSNREVVAIANALQENQGLVEFFLHCYDRESDETETCWGAICGSLETHPTLQVLHHYSRRLSGAPLAPDVIISRIQALVNLMKVNTTIHTINVDSLLSEHELFRGSVVPKLKTNRLRPRLLAIQATRPMAYRAKVLGRALLATQTDANSLWMLLSGNVEVAFPTSATAAVAVTDTDTTTLATSATGASAVDIIVAPASGQKRKARP
jgi:hypothetical protein